MFSKLTTSSASFVAHRTEKELHRRQDILISLSSKANQMASTLNMSNSFRNHLLGQDSKPVSETNRTSGLDNYGLVGLQRQIMREQDEGLEKLEEIVISTKHIALADGLDEHVDMTSSRLQRVQKRLAILNKKTKGGCSCMWLMLSVIAIVVLAVVVWALIKYL
ncbi:hypothetical protein AMTRI_Chr02g266320 [Amborella trichopoda]